MRRFGNADAHLKNFSVIYRHAERNPGNCSRAVLSTSDDSGLRQLGDPAGRQAEALAEYELVIRAQLQWQPRACFARTIDTDAETYLRQAHAAVLDAVEKSSLAQPAILSSFNHHEKNDPLGARGTDECCPRPQVRTRVGSWKSS